MQLSLGRFDISREAVLADAQRFGFASTTDAAAHLDVLLQCITAAFDGVAQWLDHEWRQLMHDRLTHNVAVLNARLLS